MRLKFLVVFFVMMFFLGFVNSAETQITTTFNVGGCTIPTTGQGVSLGYCSDRQIYGDDIGMYFCEDLGSEGYLWETLQPGLGCSMGQAVYVPGTGSCCPIGYSCEDVGGGNYQCQQRTEACVDQEIEVDCTDIDCIWITESLTCVDTVTDLGCEDYVDKITCELDPYNLALSGIGSEVVGTTIECAGEAFSISSDESVCEWDPVNNCTLKYVVNQAVSSGIAASFSCSSVYTLGDCEDGIQTVDWSASTNTLDENGDVFSGTIPEECLEAVGCSEGSGERYCGEPSIKLPGFSTFSFIGVLLVIALFYFLKRD